MLAAARRTGHRFTPKRVITACGASGMWFNGGLESMLMACQG